MTRLLVGYDTWSRTERFGIIVISLVVCLLFGFDDGGPFAAALFVAIGAVDALLALVALGARALPGPRLAPHAADRRAGRRSALVARGGVRRRRRPRRRAAARRATSTVDVAIVGGGYTGLWTALAVLDRDPRATSRSLEAEFCGAGPSGRNGGFIEGYWPAFASSATGSAPSARVRLATAG